MFLNTLNKIARSQSIHKNKSIIKETYRQLIRQKDLKFSNNFFWNKYISSLYSDSGYMGIKNKFIYEYGNIDYIEFKQIGLYHKGDVIGVIENNKTIYDIKAPIDQFKIISYNESLNYESLNTNPEFLENYIINFSIEYSEQFQYDINSDLNIKKEMTI